MSGIGNIFWRGSGSGLCRGGVAVKFAEMFDVFRAPFVHRLDDRHEARAVLGDPVFDFRRNLPVNFAVDDVVVLEFAQFGREHFLGYGRDGRIAPSAHGGEGRWRVRPQR